MLKKILSFIFFVLYPTFLFADVIIERQNLFQDFNKTMRQANASFKEQNTEELISIFEKINVILETLPNKFPDDSFEGKTSAKKEIISQREDFNKLFTSALGESSLVIFNLNDGNYDQALQHFQTLYSSCKSCHSRYKKDY